MKLTCPSLWPGGHRTATLDNTGYWLTTTTMTQDGQFVIVHALLVFMPSETITPHEVSEIYEQAPLLKLTP